MAKDFSRNIKNTHTTEPLYNTEVGDFITDRVNSSAFIHVPGDFYKEITFPMNPQPSNDTSKGVDASSTDSTSMVRVFDGASNAEMTAEPGGERLDFSGGKRADIGLSATDSEVLIKGSNTSSVDLKSPNNNINLTGKTGNIKIDGNNSYVNINNDDGTSSLSMGSINANKKISPEIQILDNNFGSSITIKDKSDPISNVTLKSTSEKISSINITSSSGASIVLSSNPNGSVRLELLAKNTRMLAIDLDTDGVDIEATDDTRHAFQNWLGIPNT